MEISINVQKSIEKRRLVYNTRSIIADYVITYIGSLLFITLACILLVTKFTIMPLGVLVIVVGFIIWMIANTILFNVLIKVDGLDIINNRTDIIKVLNNFFRLNIENKEQVVINDIKLSGFIHWGRVVTVILDDKSVYINIQTLGRADARSFFHGFTNYLKSRYIAKRFKQFQLQGNLK
jgi:hypothetical protein